MKKTFTIALLMLSIIYANSQILPNPGFELWESFTGYEDPENWNTPNQYTSLAGVTTVSKSEDAFSGTYSAKLETKSLLGGLYTAPGLLTLADFSVNIVAGTYTFGGGIALSDRVSKLTGMYKYAGANGDSASVMIISSRHPEGQPADTVGLGYGFLPDAADWTPFTIIMYPWSESQPDTFNVIIMSSGSFDLNVGSTLYVDDLSVETVTGTFDLSDRSSGVRVFPNPVTEMVKFETETTGTDRKLAIYDNSGRLVKQIIFDGNSIELNLNELPSGVYNFKLSDDNKSKKSGSFIKK